MGAQRTTFDKLQRERDKKAKAAAKRARRQGKTDEDAGDSEETSDRAPADALTAPQLLNRIEAVHHEFDAGKITFEEFEERKTELFTRLAELPMD